MAWTGGVKWGSQLFAWGATLIVARLLTPRDYGLVAMAAVYLGLTALLSEFGVGAAVVMLRDLADEQVAQINSLAVMFGIAAFALSCVIATPLGHFFNAPELPPVVIVLSFAFIITAFRTVPYSLLQREFRFKTLALIDGVQTLTTATGMVTLAVLGLGYWTLVFGGLLGTAAATLLILASRATFAWPRLGPLKRAITFSWHIVASRLAFYVYSSADQVVAGKLLGKTALGGYSFAATLATMFPEKIVSLMASVTPSIFSSVQTQPERLRRYVLSLTEGLALVTFPATLGLAAVAEPFVLTVLGEKWRVMIAPLQVLAAYAGVRSISPLPAQVLSAVGEARFAMWTQVAGAVLFPVAFLLASRWGAVGIATAWVAVHPIVNVPVFVRSFSKIGLSARHYVGALASALVGSAIMLIAILVVDRSLPEAWTNGARLAIEIGAGIIAYVLTLLTWRRHRLRIFSQTWKLIRS
jgi:O-antigen/teichoic acid export membrane protein